jgi:hypothetical protein
MEVIKSLPTEALQGFEAPGEGAGVESRVIRPYMVIRGFKARLGRNAGSTWTPPTTLADVLPVGDPDSGAVGAMVIAPVDAHVAPTVLPVANVDAENELGDDKVRGHHL